MTDSRLFELLAHRPPMLLLSAVDTVNRESAQATVWIGPESAFFEAPRGVPAWIGLEYMAQTVGLIVGHRHQQDGDPPPQGYLLGTRQFRCSRAWYPPDCRLQVHASEVLVDDNGLGAYNCRVELASSVLAQCRLTVYKKPLNAKN